MSFLKKFFKVILIILIVYLVLGMIVGPIVFASIIGRKATKSDGDYLKLWKCVREDYPLLNDREEVHFESNGKTLTAYLYEVDEPLGIVICAHGLNNTSDYDNAEYQNYFLEKGFDVLAVDLTGCGNSEGNCVRNLYKSKYDIVAAIDYVKANPKIKDLKINLVGHSAGAYGVIMASGLREVNAVLAISSYESPHDEVVSIIEDNIGKISFLVRPFIEYSLFLFGGKENYLKASDVVNSNKDTTYYLIHSSADDYVNYEKTSLMRLYYEPNVDYRKYEIWNPEIDPSTISKEEISQFTTQHKDNVYSYLLSWARHTDTWLSYDSQVYLHDNFWGPLTDEHNATKPKSGTFIQYVKAHGAERGIDRYKASELNEYVFEQVVDIFK